MPYKEGTLMQQVQPLVSALKNAVSGITAVALGRVSGSYAPARPHALLDEPIMFLTTMAAMPASTALAIGDDSMSVIGFDPGACP